MTFSVLVVDDEPALRNLIGQMLEIGGYAVTEAQNGEDALNKIEESPPDALILDVMMPRMDGITLCKIIREDPELMELPVIMLSGKTQKKAIAEGLAAGANQYLCKPVSFDELIGSIKAVLPNLSAIN
ncbi:MAG: response regulator [Chloroflexi bacterium]|nr:response regulator [Chloroflexota bacterium]